MRIATVDSSSGPDMGLRLLHQDLDLYPRAQRKLNMKNRDGRNRVHEPWRLMMMK